MEIAETVETFVAQATQFQRMIWQGHDEKDKALCLKGAVGLYSILTNADTKKIMVAARYMQEAFWISDDAEEYQTFDSELEDKAYCMAGLCLHRSRSKVGLETRSTEYTVQWWKAYRHNDKSSLIENLVKEQILQMDTTKNIGVVDNYSQEKSVQQELNNEYVLANRCAGLLLEAAVEHKKKDWADVDKKLEEYFTIYLPRVLKSF